MIFKNGILNIENWLKDNSFQLIRNTPLLMNTGYLPFNFQGNLSDPVEWLRFLHSIWQGDQESIDTLQEWFGLCLTQVTQCQKILLVLGPPRSGKGTIGRIMRFLIGEKNSIGPTLSSLAGSFGLQPWLGKSLAIISDARLSGKSDHAIVMERLLSISGEDPLTVDRKYAQSITVKLPTRIVIMNNELPHLGDSSSALTSRYLILSMNKSWLGQEDIELENRLRDELPQILNWGLEGLKRLRQRNHFIQPESARHHIQDLISINSPIKIFIEDCCVLGPACSIEIKLLYEGWIIWWKENGYRWGNLQIFCRNLRTALPQIQIKQKRGENSLRARLYEGIRLSILTN